ncbi:MAG: ATP-dependent DNA helicase RecG [Spirochaetota bacterium]|nr:MAG: ATP-dependent DNA helicase RecG [Spirochaetota bacterium]
MPLDLSDNIQYLKGVGPTVAKKLERIGLLKIGDLLYYFPRSYEDRRELKLLSSAREGERATFRFTVVEHTTFFYRGKTHPKLKVRDESGFAYLYCFNRNFITNILKIGTSFFLTGVYTRKYRVPSFSQFDYELDGDKVDLGIVPIYRLTAGLNQKMLRRLVESVLETHISAVEEDIPEFIKKGYGIDTKGELIREIHFPKDQGSLRRAKEHYSYEEFFKYQIVCALTKNHHQGAKKQRIPLNGELKEVFFKSLPFSLTAAQERVLGEIERDLQLEQPMNRLIQGDVGSGKTVVSLAAALDVVERGGQVAFMAPTEILAKQHFYTIQNYFVSLGSKRPVNVEFISGSVKGLTRKQIVLELLKGNIDIACGTHALFSEDVDFSNLSLVIIDEQQKFGVLQRGALRAKGKDPDCIVMSATPIPRTLSMTLYGDLDISVIDEMPKGREAVETHIVKQAEIKKVYQTVKEQIGEGRQVYFIYPLIEEGQTNDVKNAVDAYERLKKEVFGDLRIGLLHGRMSDSRKDDVMKMFRDQEYDILVATTVVEVGLHVPNATVMVIEQAERFGLSSIHQLRGRIGRGGQHSYCFLVPDRTTGREAWSRLRILKDTHDGFKIAEYDLKLRGPGEIIGKRQSGVPQFIIGDLDINSKLIYRAQKDARKFVEGEIGTKQERENYLKQFMESEMYRNAMLYFGG